MTGDILGAKKKEHGGGGTALRFLYYGTQQDGDGTWRDASFWFGTICTRLAVVSSFVILVCAVSTLALGLVREK